VKGAHGRRRGSSCPRTIEEADDLGPPPGLDVEHQRRDVGDDEVEPDARAALRVGLGARPAALAARAAHVIDDVALAQGTAAITHRDRDDAIVGAPPQRDAAIAGVGRIVQRVHQQLVDHVGEPVDERTARADRLGPRADLGHGVALVGIASDHALADRRTARDVLLEAEQVARCELFGSDSEDAIVGIRDQVADRRVEHGGDQLVVVEVVADDDDRRRERSELGSRGLASRAIDDDERGVGGVVGDAVAVVDDEARGGQRTLDDGAQPAIAADADRTPGQHRHSRG